MSMALEKDNLFFTSEKGVNHCPYLAILTYWLTSTIASLVHLTLPN